jgi:hypothetical protein
MGRPHGCETRRGEGKTCARAPRDQGPAKGQREDGGACRYVTFLPSDFLVYSINHADDCGAAKSRAWVQAGMKEDAEKHSGKK